MVVVGVGGGKEPCLFPNMMFVLPLPAALVWHQRKKMQSAHNFDFKLDTVRSCVCNEFATNAASYFLGGLSHDSHDMDLYGGCVFVLLHSMLSSMSAPSPGVQYMVKAVSKGYLMEQGLQQKVIQDLGLSAISQHECHMIQNVESQMKLWQHKLHPYTWGDLKNLYLLWLGWWKTSSFPPLVPQSWLGSRWDTFVFDFRSGISCWCWTLPLSFPSAKTFTGARVGCCAGRMSLDLE